MKKIYIIFLLALLFSCSDDKKESFPNGVKVGEMNYNFNMPLISADTADVKRYLKETGASVYKHATETGEKIEAIISENNSDLFYKVIYTYNYNGAELNYFNVSFVYNGVNPDNEIKEYIRNHLQNKTSVFD